MTLPTRVMSTLMHGLTYSMEQPVLGMSICMIFESMSDDTFDDMDDIDDIDICMATIWDPWKLECAPSFCLGLHSQCIRQTCSVLAQKGMITVPVCIAGGCMISIQISIERFIF